MSEQFQDEIPEDPLATGADKDIQRQAAATVQDLFSRAFRLSVTHGEWDAKRLEELVNGISNWQKAGVDDDARATRLALILSGLDQWGVAYAQAFKLTAIPALTRLMGDVRTRLTPEEEARFQQKFESLQTIEVAAIDFKIDLRRSIHLALWHAMIAGEEREDAMGVLACLGGALVHLVEAMPLTGWRLVADALTHIQLQCLNEGLVAEGLGQEMTQALFDSLRNTLPTENFNRIMALSTKALLDWQQTKRTRQELK